MNILRTPTTTGHQATTRGRALAFGVLILALAAPPWRSSEAAEAGSETDPLAILARLKRGEELARVVCQSCHVLPEPELLDKRSWTTGPLRKMATFLGLARVNLDQRPDRQFLIDANVYPPAPLLPVEDWKAIWDYYVANAPEQPLPQERRARVAATNDVFRVELGRDPAVEPAVTMVHIDSLRHRLVVGDARNRALHVLDGHGRRLYGTVLDSAPVSFVPHGDAAYVCLIGSVFPSDEKTGQLVDVRPRADGFAVERVFEGLKRPVDCAVADLDGDGRPDLALAQFGNLLGRQSWFARGDGTNHTEQPLWELPGGTRVIAVDANRDGRTDLLYLMAQAREGVYLFENLGGGEFAATPLLQFPPIYGSTYLELADFNGDGAPDLLVTHGDNGEYASPFKRFHGLRVYLNDGRFRFREAWFFPLDGAFKAVARDFDGDGDLDIAAISFFADYSRTPAESFVYLENRGGWNFAASTVPEATAGRWLTMDVGDLDGDGALDVVLGSFIDGPRATPIPAALTDRWAAEHVSTLILHHRGLRPRPLARP